MDCSNFNFSSFSSTNSELLSPVQPFSSRGTESYLPTSPPSFPQLNTYNGPNQTAYMQQELSRYKERCSVLERELLKVSTERDLAKSLFEQLSGPRVGMATLTLPVKREQDYPYVRFWRRDTFSAWTSTAEASKHSRVRLAYLEDETGKMISDQTLKALRKTIKSAWMDLAMNNKAPKQWGQASASAKNHVRDIVCKQFPFVELAENDWKMDDLCGLDYPGWVRNNVDKISGKCVDTETIKSESDDTTTGGGEQNLGIRKRKVNPKERQSMMRAEKKLKRDSDDMPDDSPVDSPAPDSSETDLSSVPAFVEPDTPYMRTSPSPTPSSASSKLLVATREGCQKAITEAEVRITTTDILANVTANETEDVVSGNIGSTDTTNPTIAGGAISRNSGVTTHIVIDAPNVEDGEMGEGVSAFNRDLEDSTGGRTRSGSDDADNINLAINPLQMLSKGSLKLKIPPLANIPPLQEAPKSGQTSSEGNAPRPAESKKDRKMRVPKNKTAYYLCARRWLKQVEKSGTNEQFRQYWYKVLTNNQREAYKTECNELITKDLWNDNVCDGTLH